jgi:large subunit ribosomal protein L4
VPQVSVLDRTGGTRETLALDDAVFGARLNGPLVHQAVVRDLAGRRAGTHATRGRSEVSGGGRKPWRQKGTGRARQGSIRATQWKGGGKPFGPTPRSHAQAMPRRARRAALSAALSDALQTGRLRVIDTLAPVEPKTKALVAALIGLGLAPVPTLLVVAERDATLERASRNIRWLTIVHPRGVSIADVLRYQQIVCDRAAVLALQEALLP